MQLRARMMGINIVCYSGPSLIRVLTPAPNWYTGLNTHAMEWGVCVTVRGGGGRCKLSLDVR